LLLPASILLVMIRTPPRPTLFPYATLFRSLATRRLSTIFGQGRSDYHPFWEASVPIVFFTDATNACYHTTRDDLELLDTDKLARSEEHTSELQSRENRACRLLLEKNKSSKR